MTNNDAKRFYNDLMYYYNKIHSDDNPSYMDLYEENDNRTDVEFPDIVYIKSCDNPDEPWRELHCRRYN